MNGYTATYSPDDNKLRLEADFRLDKDEYQRVRAAGFRWAPKQGVFVAPAWTPGREDLLLELAGEIEDDDTSLMERAEERADRFDGYQEHRREDSNRAQKAAMAISDAIPMGQPILVGHHSEKGHRKALQRMDDNMRKAVNQWKTADYWERRAAAALAHAEYKERPDVRARRIKRIEADKRKCERNKAAAEKSIAAWSDDGLTLEKATALANVSGGGYYSFPLDKYPRNPPASQYEGEMSLWGALDGGVIDHEQARELVLPRNRRTVAWADRWLTHYNNRLSYERAMLADQGGTLADRTPCEKGGAIRCLFAPGYGNGWATIVRVNKVTVTILHNYGNGGRNFRQTVPFDKIREIMTADQVAEAREAGRVADTEDGCGFFLAKKAEPETTDAQA